MSMWPINGDGWVPSERELGVGWIRWTVYRLRCEWRYWTMRPCYPTPPRSATRRGARENAR